MSNSDSDRWLKRVWLVNGVVLLGGMVIGIGVAAVAAMTEWRGNKAVAVAAAAPGRTSDDGAPVRAVRYDIPASVRGTDTKLVLVHNGADFLPQAAGSGPSRKQYSESDQQGPAVNVIFLPARNGAARLLVDRPAYISDVSYPGEEYGRADSLQTWISYEVVLVDTNGDGKLNEDDERQLMVSDREGNNLVRVLPPGWRLKEYSTRRDHRTMVITAFELPKSGEKFDDRRAAEHAFLYDVPTGKLESFVALDSAVARAGRVLAKVASVR